MMAVEVVAAEEVRLHLHRMVVTEVVAVEEDHHCSSQKRGSALVADTVEGFRKFSSTKTLINKL